ncbi:MAG: MOSC N-terminal beta barrel domain-containing protein [Steroidobacteraceae bacterium]|jgi:uncharacterized protein YcbX|nr:MOSC N-terminal beta barrel domain-containing protein [Steroidobacteraceae bacterium]
MDAIVTSLHVYPVKACRGLDLVGARLDAAGFEHDRRWLVVTPEGRFVTQREAPALARVGTAVADGRLELTFPDGARVPVAPGDAAQRLDVVVWDDRCAGLDCGDAPAARLGGLLGRPVRLVEFDTRVPRLQRSERVGPLTVPVRYPDAYPILLIGEESLEDLNARLPQPLPMDRFRPNVVVRGLGAYGEDRVVELRAEGVRLRPVKACTRCKVTMTDQATGDVDAAEPLRTLRTYRWDRELRGVTFGQNVVIAEGAGATLRVGQRLEVVLRD